MDDCAWHIQIFQMSSVAAQEAVIDRLGDSVVAVDAQSCDLGIYVIVESRDAKQARSVSELVATSDPQSHLIHETHGSLENAAVLTTSPVHG